MPSKRTPGRFRQLYNFKDEYGAGRSYILMHVVLHSVQSNLASGLFYTSFLVMNGIDLVNVGIMTFVPYIANAFQILTPWFLGRFPRRRWVLVSMRGTYYTLFILGITVLPTLVADQDVRLVCFVGLTLLANIINAISLTGFSTWHANFLPEKMRADYFSIQSMVSTLVGQGLAIAVAIVADLLTGTPYEQGIIVGIRYLAYAVAVVDLVVLASPKEYPYPRSEKTSVVGVVRNPLRHRAFTLTMLVCFAHTFVTNIPAGVTNYFLLTEVGVSYFYVYFINMSYGIFLWACIKPWRRFIARHGWMKTYVLGELLLIPTYILYAFVTPGNYLWLFLLVRFAQHFIGVGYNTAASNFLYMNLPDEDRDDFITFHHLGTQLVSGLGVLAGTLFVSWVGDGVAHILGYALSAAPLLILVHNAGRIACAALAHCLTPRITPRNDHSRDNA